MKAVDEQAEIRVNNGRIFYNEDQDLCFWPVDNSNPNDKNVQFLRGFLVDITISQEYVQKLVPIPWLSAIDKLVLLSETESLVHVEANPDDSDGTTTSVVSVLRDCGALSNRGDGVNEKATAVAFLKFCRGLGLFVYFDNVPGLQKYCILSPQWIIDQLAYIIRDFKLHRFVRDYKAMALDDGKAWKNLLNRAILNIPLLQKFWGGEEIGKVEFLLNFMVNVGLFGELPGKDGGNRLLVSSLKTRSSNICSLESRKWILSKLDEKNAAVPGAQEEQGFNASGPLSALNVEGTNVDTAIHDVEHTDSNWCVESFTFLHFLPSEFYDRLVATLVNKFSGQESSLSPGGHAYKDPLLFHHGCVLYFNGSKDVAFGVYFNTNALSIDIIVARDKVDLMEIVCPEIKVSITAINHKFYHERLEIKYPLIASKPFTGFSKYRDSSSRNIDNSLTTPDTSDAASQALMTKDEEYKKLEAIARKHYIESFASNLEEYGEAEENRALELATKIVQKKKEATFFEFKNSFDAMNDQNKFQEEYLKTYLNDLEDQLVVLKALKDCNDLPHHEEYLIGCFISSDLLYVKREKLIVKININNTKARLSAHVDKAKKLGDLLSKSKGKKYKVFHFAMHSDKLKKEIPERKLKALSERCAHTQGNSSSNKKGSVQCIFLNVCSSSDLAETLCREYRVPHVISWSTKVSDEAALNFAERFYHNLSSDRDEYTNFQDAFEVAKEELEDRNWVLIDPDDEKACKETLKTNLDQKAAGILRFHWLSMMSMRVTTKAMNQKQHLRVIGIRMHC